MTSTIAPAVGAFLLRHNDPHKRLEDYREAMSFYVSLLQADIVDQLVYADNSGHDLAALRQIALEAGVLDRCEFISFHTPAVADVSRYYLEINLLNEAIARSQFLAQDDVDIWKVTGRYLIPNAARIIQRAPAADLYINCRNRPEWTIDFFIVRFTKAVFRTLLFARIEEFRTIRTGEDILRERIDAFRDPDLKIIPRFNETPRVVGTRGYDGARYEGPKGFAKYLLRSWSNKLLPQVWI
ncbi:MAG TPA: hypothetical protein VNS79_07610 [Sphingobium sp.]|nr:hypothetical protein [Sphingobium sp.]